ncbi:hypothetical protein LTR66_016864, partial [Elasticomyces elasticus]
QKLSASLPTTTAVSVQTSPPSQYSASVTPANKQTPTTNGTNLQKRPIGPSALLDDRIPENMYLPDKSEDKESWIHRDKLAKIESEELQVAGVNLAKARSRTSTRISSPPLASTTPTDRGSVIKREEKRQRLSPPAEIEDEIEHADWDVRLPEEIDAEAHSALQMYSNPVLRKSGSKIPILTSSPAPLPAERYERDTPIARKRTASGTMSFEANELGYGKQRANGVTSPSTVKTSSEEGDTIFSSVASPSARQGSPQKQRISSATLLSPPSTTLKKVAPSQRMVSAPLRNTSSASNRPHTRDGSVSERPRTAVSRPEGDPPWLATMYKPDPMLPPDKQIIPTIAKRQMQEQWERDNAVPKTYDTQFHPIAVHSKQYLPQPTQSTNHERTPSPAMIEVPPETHDPKPLSPLQPTLSTMRPNGERPGTSGSITAGYSTMPKITSPPMRENSVRMSSNPLYSRSTAQPAPMRMQAQSLEEDEKGGAKEKKGCGCCVVM